ncbi:MAG: glycogen/starch/alpha-glucan phosphorylase [Ignavibacteriaceae bacterium]|nr:glycogen/starch/alpha-glucan phosphorylase [Ignavibacteriaceae bacterium]
MKDSLFFTDYESPSSFSLKNQFAEHLEFLLVKNKETATDDDMYHSLSMSIRDRLVRKWLRTQHKYYQEDVKKVYYLSLEFLMGRILGNSLINMDYYEECREILKKEGYILEDIIELEHDMGLGNGGLGRLAACFLDSMATLQLPAFGYGIRYEYGIFKQDIMNGRQVEQPDYWLKFGNPWEIVRRELTYRVKFYGKVNSYLNKEGKLAFHWVDTEDVMAVAYDVPVPGYDNDIVNNLRLWSAKATEEFSFNEFNSGNYVAAVETKNISENISKVLYPNDTYTEGKYLRLKQQYFFVSASLQDIIRTYKLNHSDFSSFHEKVAIQLNDTHPVIAIPELLRILLDDEEMGWEKAWEITTKTFGYTNHTVVPEALEEWSVRILEELLPRHLQIIYEINHRFLNYVRQVYTRDDAVISKLSIIREGNDKKVRMANLAIVGSHSVNGVAELHSNILKKIIFPEFNELYPKKFKNVTNGITFRRWLRYANPLLSNLITEKIGKEWVKDAEELRKLEDHLNEPDFIESWASSKEANKMLLKEHIESELGISVPVDSIFDVQIKRFHEYKRQLLNVLHIITLYNRIKANPGGDYVPRTFIFGGKAAPAYTAAKLIIKLINDVGNTVNNDPVIGDRLKVVFIPNYSVTAAERIMPAADLSEQISTAGLEASGTGNMKFALNGALTIGTMDGANIEIRKEVGKDNIFIFGLLSEEVHDLRVNGYDPKIYYNNDPELRQVIDMLAKNYFNPTEPGIYHSIVSDLLDIDYYFLLADYRDYVNTQDKVSELYRNRVEWTKKSVINCARIGYFSSDRAISEYAKKIWKVKPVNFKIDQ